MTNTQYIEAIIGSCERIYIDTATLMEEGILQFISNNEELLIATGRKLIVPQTVRSELARHLDGEDEAKRNNALRAIGLIADHPTIFEVENIPISDEEIAKAFADAQLLSELTLHKSDCNQLLITNDRHLSRDAFFLNQQQSCKGHQIKVCYINRSGHLNCCDCVKEFFESQKAEQESPEVRATTVASPQKPDVDNAGWHFDFRSAGVGVIAMGIIGFCARNYKTILRAFC